MMSHGKILLSHEKYFSIQLGCVKSIFSPLFFSSHHYERNFLVEKQINVSDSSFNFHVCFFKSSRFSRLLFRRWCDDNEGCGSKKFYCVRQLISKFYEYLEFFLKFSATPQIVAIQMKIAVKFIFSNFLRLHYASTRNVCRNHAST